MIEPVSSQEDEVEIDPNQPYTREGEINPRQPYMREGEIDPSQPITQFEVREWQNEWVFDEAGEAIGKISDVLVGADAAPEWMILSYGAFLRNDRLVPVFDIKQGEHGFIVSYSKDMVHKAPVVSVTDMSDKDEEKLTSYWCTDRSAAMPRSCSMLSRGA